MTHPTNIGHIQPDFAALVDELECRNAVMAACPDEMWGEARFRQIDAEETLLDAMDSVGITRALLVRIGAVL